MQPQMEARVVGMRNQDNMKRKRRTFLSTIIRLWLNAFGLLLAFSFFSSRSASFADEVPEYQLKAAFLYNFAKFIEWPSSRSMETLNICTISSEIVAKTLRDIAKQNVGERRVNILLIGDKGSPSDCHLLFIEKQYSNYLSQHTGQLAGVVTVGETEDFSGKGGVITFYKENDKLRFEVHLGNAKQAGVTMNARLLRLAKVVGG